MIIKSFIKIKLLKVGVNHMDVYKCSVCGYTYDPEVGEPRKGIKPGTPFEELPDNWFCPQCGAGKIRFRKPSIYG